MSTNGAISFGSGWFFWYPQPFPTTQFFVRNAYVVAPFWSDNDIRRNGTIRYETHTRSTGTNSTSGQLLDQVSSFIVNQENLTTGSFLGQWMLVAEWDDVHPYPHGGVSVGVDTFLDKVGTTISKCTLSFKDVCKFWHMTHTHTHTQLYIMHMRRFHETLN